MFNWKLISSSLNHVYQSWPSAALYVNIEIKFLAFHFAKARRKECSRSIIEYFQTKANRIEAVYAEGVEEDEGDVACGHALSNQHTHSE